MAVTRKKKSSYLALCLLSNLINQYIFLIAICIFMCYNIITFVKNFKHKNPPPPKSPKLKNYGSFLSYQSYKHTITSKRNNFKIQIETETSEQRLKKVAKGGGIVFAGSIVDKGIRFLLQILLGRILGASGYGLYSLEYSLTQKGVLVFIWKMYKNLKCIEKIVLYAQFSHKIPITGRTTFLSINHSPELIISSF